MLFHAGYSILNIFSKTAFAMVICSQFIFQSQSEAAEKFKACQNIKASDSTKPRSPLNCASSKKPQVITSLLPSLQTLNDHSEFMTFLRKSVRDQLIKEKNYYSQLSRCGQKGQNKAFCAKSIESTRTQIRRDWPSLRTAVAIANLPIWDRQSSYNPKPSHLLRGGTQMKSLTAPEIKLAETFSFEESFKGLPSDVKARAKRAGPRLVISNSDRKLFGKFRKNQKEMRKSATQKYFGLIAKNPLLFHISDVSASNPQDPSLEQIRNASQKMLKAIESEITELNLSSSSWSPDEKKDRGLAAYNSLIEEILKKNPRFCTAATNWARVAGSNDNKKELLQNVAVAGASIVALSACSTAITCGAGVASLAAVENGIARSKTTKAVRSALAQASASQSASSFDKSREAQTEETIVLAATVATGGAGGASSKQIKNVMRSRVTKKMTKWNPKNAKDIEHYFRTHVTEVTDTAYKFFDEYKQHFTHLKRSDIKRLSDHDFEKFAHLSDLKKYGFEGVPVEIFEGIKNGPELIKKYGVTDGKVQMAVKDFLKIMWGESKESLSRKIAASNNPSEVAHLNSMLRLRNYMIESMEKIESKGMVSVSRSLGRPAEIEYRFLEVFADKPVRARNPITANEMGRSAYSTLKWVEQQGPEGLAKAISETEGREAAREFVEKVGWNNILKMAKRTDEIYTTRGVPTSIENRLRNTAQTLKKKGS